MSSETLDGSDFGSEMGLGREQRCSAGRVAGAQPT
jgi:hypothetical protein